MRIFVVSCFWLISLTMNTLVAQQAANSYPKTTGYISAVHPLVSLDKNGASYNFTNYYSVGFPCGINILKSDRIGFSFEVAPFLKVIGSSSKTNNLLIHPGIMFRRPHGFTIVTRLALETAGRYGTTLVFNKVFYKTAMNSYWFSVPIPVRFGNDLPASIGMALQLGVTF
ncbi:MAG: hypothetical protein WCO43_01720 [Chitinophagia bacterium]